MKKFETPEIEVVSFVVNAAIMDVDHDNELSRDV